MSDRRAAALLAAAVALAAAYRFPGLGFYNDDYALLSALADAASGPSGLFRGFFDKFAPLFYARPVTLAVLPAFYAAFGSHAWAWHLASRLLDLAAGWALCRWLEEEGAPRPAALLAALLFVLFPNHDAARCWPSGLVAQGGLAGTLLGLALYRRGRRAAGAVVLLAAMLFYEASSLLWLFIPLSAWLKERRARAAVAASWPLMAAFAAGALFQRVAVPVLWATERHPVSLSPAHAFKVLGAGLELTAANRLLHCVARGARWAAASFGPAAWAAWALAAAAVGLGARALAAEGEAPPPSPLLPFAGAAFLAGYAPYFFDATYMPTAFSANNRLNLTASLGGAALLAWVCLRWRRGGPALAGLLAAAFLLTGWASNGQYAAAAEAQRSVLDALTPLVPRDAKSLLLYGIEERVGSAVVFESTYDLEGALALRGVRVGARVGQGRMRFDADKAVLLWFGETPVPYDGLYGYDHRARRLARLPDAAAAEAFARAARP